MGIQINKIKSIKGIDPIETSVSDKLGQASIYIIICVLLVIKKMCVLGT